MTSLPVTVRVIGIAVADGGRALDIALIETDGGTHIRHVETERQPLVPAGDPDAAIALVRCFMGDRALQPFAIDVLALAAEMGAINVATLARGVDVTCLVGHPDERRRGSRAERSAFAAVALLVERHHDSRDQISRRD